MKNFVPARYRGVALATVNVPLESEALRRHFIGREAYFTTEFIVVRRDAEVALVRVTKAPGEDLFLPITNLELLAGPEECAVVDAPEVDTGVPTQMGRAALALAPDRRCVVVHGLYEHVNFILDPMPVRVRVIEVGPPWPPKLAHQAQRVLESAESLPPVDLRQEVTDLVALASEKPSAHYLYPCRGSGAAPAEAQVSYLDERPPRQDWTLVGCERSRQIHSWVYGSEAPRIELCPRKLAQASASTQVETATLTKCCLLQFGVEREGLTVTVPWGASLAEVHEGLRVLLSAAEPAWEPA